jgi:hypothetical protein
VHSGSVRVRVCVNVCVFEHSYNASEPRGANTSPSNAWGAEDRRTLSARHRPRTGHAFTRVARGRLSPDRLDSCSSSSATRDRCRPYSLQVKKVCERGAGTHLNLNLNVL